MNESSTLSKRFQPRHTREAIVAGLFYPSSALDLSEKMTDTE